MTGDFPKRKCAGCGKTFVMTTEFPGSWAYKWPRCNKSITKFFCSWKCYHGYLKEVEENEHGRSSKRDAMTWEY